MAPRSDRLSTEVSISAKLEDRQVSLNAKSRFVTAVDRLLGAAADIPTSYLEGIAERVRSRNAILIKQLRRENTRADETIEQAVSDSILLREIEQLTNKKAVIDGAIEHLEVEVDAAAGSIEGEWIQTFDKYSGLASADRVRDVWSRVLAKEIHKPGRFSLSTLRFISELDSQMAELFERHAEFRSAEGFILSPGELSGQTLVDLSFLQEVGLLLHVGGFAQTKLSRETDGNFYFVQDEFALCFKSASESQSEVQVPIIFMTRIGREVCSILPKNDEINFLTKVFAQLGDQIQSAEIMRIPKKLPNGQVQLRPHLKLK